MNIKVQLNEVINKLRNFKTKIDKQKNKEWDKFVAEFYNDNMTKKSWFGLGALLFPSLEIAEKYCKKFHKIKYDEIFLITNQYRIYNEFLELHKYKPYLCIELDIAMYNSLMTWK